MTAPYLNAFVENRLLSPLRLNLLGIREAVGPQKERDNEEDHRHSEHDGIPELAQEGPEDRTHSAHDV